MKIKCAFLMIFVFIISCGQEKPSLRAKSIPEGVILSAFSDIKNASSLDYSDLQDVPPVVDLTSEMSPVKNQANRGSCSYFSALALIEAAIKKDQKKEVNLSEEYLIYKTKSLGFSSLMESSTVEENLNVLKRVGMLLESDAPYRPSWFEEKRPCAAFSNQPGSGAPFRCFSHDSPPFEVLKRVVSADPVEVISIGSTTNSIIKYLGQKRRPLSITLLVHNDGWPKSGDVFYNEELRNQCLRDRGLCGGHAVILTGYDLSKRVFYFKNSWGEEWGDKGYGTVPFETVDLYSEKDYQSVQLKGDLVFFENKKREDVLVKSFQVNSEVKEDHKLKVKILGDLQHVAGRFLYVTSVLVKQASSIRGAGSDQTTHIIPLSAENALKHKTVAAKSSFSLSLDNPQIDKILWSEETPLFLDIPDHIMILPEIQEELSSKKSNVLLRVTLYEFSDVGYRTIKRIYRAL
ncbi:MAG: C1 family peptidase [Bacteriovorax sp.]|nr:C1 family peptidase [Bacteriovorax sp.]